MSGREKYTVQSSNISKQNPKMKLDIHDMTILHCSSKPSALSLSLNH